MGGRAWLTERVGLFVPGGGCVRDRAGLVPSFIEIWRRTKERKIEGGECFSPPAWALILFNFNEKGKIALGDLKNKKGSVWGGEGLC